MIETQAASAAFFIPLRVQTHGILISKTTHAAAR
jgi:hypothetical protein